MVQWTILQSLWLWGSVSRTHASGVGRFGGDVGERSSESPASSLPKPGEKRTTLRQLAQEAAELVYEVEG